MKAIQELKKYIRAGKSVMIDHTLDGQLNRFVFRLVRTGAIKEIAFDNNYGIYKPKNFKP